MKNPKKSARIFVFDEEGLKLLATQLKALRAQKQFTQQSLAYEADITLSQIARIETVNANPTVSTLFKIARTLNVPPAMLF